MLPSDSYFEGGAPAVRRRRATFFLSANGILLYSVGTFASADVRAEPYTLHNSCHDAYFLRKRPCIRASLETHADGSTELLVGFHKVNEPALYEVV